MNVLVINCGSSSLKYQLIDSETENVLAKGLCERIGIDGRLVINANGDVDPCVFIHFSNANIKECTLLEALKSPIFMEYHKGQPFNKNMLRPCPMLENPELLRKMVERAGAKSTDLQSPETAEHLCAKCDHYAEVWKKQADELWSESQAKKAAKKSTTC